MSDTLHSSLRAIWASVHSPSGGVPFPVTVGKLIELGISRYRIDYVAKNVTSYGPDGFVDVEPFPSHIPTSQGTESFDQVALVEAIRKAQRGEGEYIDFAASAVGAGVTEYTAYLQGKKVIYSGALGDQHTEWFPGVKPADD